MNLRDMLDGIEESPVAEVTAGMTRYAKDKGQSAQQLQKGVDQLKQRKDVASQGAGKLASDMDRLMNSKFAPAIQRMLDALDQADQVDAAGQDQQLVNSVDLDQDIEEAIGELEEAIAGEIPINVLSNVMIDDKDVPLIRQALRQIQNERGINKRFMPALKVFLEPYVDILKSGFTGYNQMSAIRKALVADPAQQDQQPQEPAEPTDAEAHDYGAEKGLPTVTPDQVEIAKDLMKKDQEQEEPEQDDEENPQAQKPKQKMAASKYNEEIQELKVLAGLQEAEGMPSKKHVMDMCKDGMSFAEMCKMHPEADKDNLKDLVDKCKEEMKESVSEAKDDMPSKAQVMKCCKDGMSVSEICKKFPDCNQEKLKELCKECMAEMKESVSEAMSDAYGEVSSPEKVEGSVEFRQHKNTDKGSVSIEASGDDMQELAKVLKMAGLTLPDGMNPEPEHDEPENHDEPEEPCDSEEPEDKKVMVVSPQDASMSTNKEVLVNYLKDKLKKSIS